MKVVGLTGGIACGKSTVSAYLRELGAVIVDGDIIAREVTENMKTFIELMKVFGSQIVDDNGKLDRKALGAIVFGNKEALKKLNDIVHPEVEAQIKFIVQLYRDKNFKGILVLDIPLLIEIKLFEMIEMDELWLVSIDRETQLRRLMDRNDLTEEEANARITSQLSLEEKSKFADIIIDNSMDIEHLHAQIDLNYLRLFNEIK